MIVSHIQKQSKAKTSPASKSAAPEINASHDQVRERAFNIYQDRGSEPVHEVQDWLRAELQIHER
ncbi:MAG: DUF2934 domain-containing protein [Terracidiphilus sp.]